MNQIQTLQSARAPQVVALVYDGLCTFEFGITAEIFGLDRPEMGPDWYRFAVAAVDTGEMRAHGGLRFHTDGGLELLAGADLIVIPGWKGRDVPVPEALAQSLRDAWMRGARIASICSGAFALAGSGLLAGRRAATHWRYAAHLAELCPETTVDADVLYTEDDRIFTSAGSAAGIDLMLHIVRSDFGADAANSVARRLVVPAHRNGGQAQYVERPVPLARETRFSALFDTIRADPSRRWTLADMADAASMSERTFLRRFRDATGTSPQEWLRLIRLDLARQALETTDTPVEAIAADLGFGTASGFRQQFRAEVGVSPRDYRANYR
ncbi:transcriptional regulator FtrA [Primorskyibacter flagellatus]|uniref:Transcriptional regulator FtrA n=1 Tax=Primorskyibacter flagellatus TaxID=1387277 RepID=A0A917AED4_9RHOB|nr:transcriptional regulator FtrA [Primorskyibacter flagellatus]GGE45232.1 transcriptional regulator FtrA [Primorskyibacter flagellatus]